MDREKVLRRYNKLCFIFVLLFILVVLAFRILSRINIGTTNDQIESPTNPIIMITCNILESVFFFLIPVSTSLLCFIVNYLSYSPIDKMLQKKRREILFKQEDVNELKALIAEFESKSDEYEFLKSKDEIMYNAANDMIDSMGDYYKVYVRIALMKKLRSPADTTELAKL